MSHKKEGWGNPKLLLFFVVLVGAALYFNSVEYSGQAVISTPERDLRFVTSSPVESQDQTIKITMPRPRAVVDTTTLLLAVETIQTYSSSKNYIGLQQVTWSLSPDGINFFTLPQIGASKSPGLISNFLDPATISLPNGNYILRVQYVDQGKTDSDQIPIIISAFANEQQGGECSCTGMQVKDTGASALQPPYQQHLLNQGGGNPHALGQIVNPTTVKGQTGVMAGQRFDVIATTFGNVGACTTAQKVKGSYSAGNGGAPIHLAGSGKYTPTGPFGTNNPGINFNAYHPDNYKGPSRVQSTTGNVIAWTDTPGGFLSMNTLQRNGGLNFEHHFIAKTEGSEYTENGVRKKGDSCICTWKTVTKLDANGQPLAGNGVKEKKCMTVTCGDGKVDPHGLEQCDDGNTEENDDCDNTCKLTFCGDGKIQTGSSRNEECDPPTPGEGSVYCPGEEGDLQCLANCLCEKDPPKPEPGQGKGTATQGTPKGHESTGGGTTSTPCGGSAPACDGDCPAVTVLIGGQVRKTVEQICTHNEKWEEEPQWEEPPCLCIPGQ